MGATVFISCGQESFAEKEFAQVAKAALIDCGFQADDIYIATTNHSLRSVVENIYGVLKTAEYFLFIDLERPGDVSFSVFSHQELAVASFLELPVLVFQHSGARTREGIFRYVMANAVTFSDKRDLADKIKSAVKSEKWDPRYKRCLKVTYDDKDTTTAIDSTTKLPMHFHHAKVTNLHNKIIARDTTVYLESYTDLAAGGSTTVIEKLTEIKWAGTTLPNIPIMPGYPRMFDCVITVDAVPGYAFIPVQTDASDYKIQIPTGRYKLQYVVICDVFPPARLFLEIEIGPPVKGTGTVITQIT